MNHLVLFDGECHFCDSSVQFIIKRDKKALFSFASLQSEMGQDIRKRHRVPADLDSLLVVTDGKCYTRSAAALKICKHLDGGWKFLYILILVPRPIRDFFYQIVARNRYKWFGKKESCTLPSPEVRKRFLS